MLLGPRANRNFLLVPALSSRACPAGLSVMRVALCWQPRRWR